jgi:hypothetical protein
MLDFNTTPIVQAIAVVETNNRIVVGDGGRALSVYQIHEAFWLDVKAKFPNVDIGENWMDIGGTDSTSQLRARNCCTLGVEMIAEYLDQHGAEVNPLNIYAAYTIGRAGFKNCAFDIQHINFPAFKRAKCHRVAALVAQFKNQLQ